MKVHIFCLQDENRALENSAFERQSLFDEASEEKHKLLAKLDEAMQNASRQAAKAKEQTAELMKLQVGFSLVNQADYFSHIKEPVLKQKQKQAEMGTFSAATSSAEQLTREKQSLNRELERVRPELERLQSQLSSHKSLLSAKSELERHINSLEVDLENEKRSSERAQLKQEGRLEELRHKLRESEKALATERQRARSKFNQEQVRSPKRVPAKVQKQPSPEPLLDEPSATPMQASFEEKRSLTPAQSSPEPAEEEVVSKHTVAKPLKKPKSFETSLASLTIQTPGNGGQAMQGKTKGRAFAFASAVEKSAFSITPFLNKTRTIGDESPEPTPQNAAKRTESCSDEDVPTPEILKPNGQSKMKMKPATSPKKTSQTSVRQSKPQTATAKKRTKPLDDTSSSMMNLSMPAPTTKKNKPVKLARKAASLDDDEEDEKENTPLSKPRNIVEPPTDDSLAPSAPPGDNKRKKRKLLGAPKAILDEDDDDGESMAQIAAQPLGKRRLKGPLGGLTSAFGSVNSTFSPLKRDRRGVNASFLGA